MFTRSVAMLHVSDKQQGASLISLVRVLYFYAGFNICIQWYTLMHCRCTLGSRKTGLNWQFLRRFSDSGVSVVEYFYGYGFEFNLEITRTSEFLKTIEIAPIRRTSVI